MKIIEDKITVEDKIIGTYGEDPQTYEQCLFVEFETFGTNLYRHIRTGDKAVLGMKDPKSSSVLTKESKECIGCISKEIVVDIYNKGFVIKEIHIHGTKGDRPWLWMTLN